MTFPVKSRTLVFRCADPAVLRQAQKIVGGTVNKSPNPRAEGVWRLISEARELPVVIATDDRCQAPARYEAWGASGKLRDCDGRTCRFVIDPKSGERQDNVSCWCAAHELGAEDPEACRITTRLSLLIPAFAAIPGIGVWQLESRGRTTFADLKGLRELFQRLDLPGAMGAPVTLLRRTLSLQMHEPLRQRIAVQYHLDGLLREDLDAYLAHQLKAAGVNQPLFDDTARQALYQATKGIPRKVNKLALTALRLAAARKASVVTEAILLDAATEALL